MMTMKNKILLSYSFVLFLASATYAQTYIAQVKSMKNKKWGYITNTGEIIVEPQYESCYRFSSDGVAVVFDSNSNQYIFINAKGAKIMTDVKSYKVALEEFRDGLITVKYNDKWGYFDKSGKVAIPAKYDEVNGFGNGHAAVTVNKKIFIIDTQGKETPVGPGIIQVREFSENLAPFRSSDKKFGFIDTAGKIIIKPQFETVGYFKNGIAWARTTDGILGFIGTDGEWIVQPQFSFAGNFDSESGLARIKTGSQWGYVDKQGKILRKDDSMVWEDFSEGLALGKKDLLFGYFNNKGEWEIKPQFDGGRDFKNGYAAAKKGNKWGIIDRTGKWVIEPIFDSIKDMEAVN
jgi:WG containing repeat